MDTTTGDGGGGTVVFGSGLSAICDSSIQNEFKLPFGGDCHNRVVGNSLKIVVVFTERNVIVGAGVVGSEAMVIG